MKPKKAICKSTVAAFLLLLLIFDTETSIKAARDAIELCMKVIIPSLLPFFIITSYLCTAATGIKLPGISGLCKLLKIPSGGESLLVLGFLGGYPVGAQLIADAYHNRTLSKRTANCMMAYCNNAGPAFIFGIISALFPTPWYCAILWAIHIVSAIFAGLLLQKPEETTVFSYHTRAASITDALEKSIHICSYVCGWIIVFKILTEYVTKLFADFLTGTASIILTGILELSNGCIRLASLESMSLRFILCSALLALGGGCVTLQTASACKNMGLGNYIPGKLLQAIFSIILSLLASILLFN